MPENRLFELAEFAEGVCLRTNVIAVPQVGFNAVKECIDKLGNLCPIVEINNRYKIGLREIMVAIGQLASGEEATVITITIRDGDGWIATLITNYEPPTVASKLRVLLQGGQS